MLSRWHMRKQRHLALARPRRDWRIFDIRRGGGSRAEEQPQRSPEWCEELDPAKWNGEAKGFSEDVGAG
jgi:hypothetical protein